jgi:hypothetical protein
MWEEAARNLAAMWQDIEGVAAMWQVCGILTVGLHETRCGEVDFLYAAVEGEALVCVRSYLQSESGAHVEDVEGKQCSLRGELVVADFVLQTGTD